MPDPRTPAVTVAVVSWNTRALLDACLRSLRPYAEAGLADVHVVDNASNDGSAEMVRSQHTWVRLVASEANIGFGPAVNVVARESRTPWIAAANADVELLPGALERLLAAGDADPQAGILAPRLILPDGSTQHSALSFPTLPFTLAFNLGLQRIVPRLGDRLCLPGYWDAERPRRVAWAVGALLLVRRAAWDAVAGFDESQWMYAEDLDLGWRAAQAGWHTRYVPDATVRHNESAATSQVWGRERAGRAQLSAYAWMLRRRGALRTRMTALVNVAGAAVRWLLLSVPGRQAPRRAATAAWVRWHARGLRRRAALERHR